MADNWFSKFGWNENPFKIQPDPEHIVGFVDMRAKIMAYVDSHDPFLVVGPTGAGKTTLLLWVSEQPSDMRYVYHNFLEEKSDARLRGKIRGLRWLLDRRPIVVLLDEVQEMDSATARYLRGLFDKGRIRSLVMAAMTDTLPNLEEPLLARIGERRIYVRNLDEREAMQIVRQRVFARGSANPLDEEALKMAFAYADYAPRRVLETCERLCMEAAAQGKARVDTDFASLVLKPKESTLINIKHAVIAPPSGEIKRLVREKLRQIMESDVVQTPSAAPVGALSPTQQKVVDALRGNDMTTDELAKAVGITRASAAKHLSRLALNTDAELLKSKGVLEPVVVQKGTGRPVVYALSGRYRH
ncbi:MAG: AAA family ATPase [Candidatus Aenigmarchaeota archaeon]|nr:AAA family ATPase [Candidatus Aenigmarchaeota archaeon]